MLASLANWSWGQDGGNHWAPWVSYLSFFREVAKLTLPEYARWIHYENAATYGSHRFMHAKFCMVSDFPEVVSRGEGNRPHRSDGPALKWRDGCASYYWRGVKVPAAWIERKGELDPKLGLTHENIEMRRVVAEIVGWKAVLASVPSRSIQTDRFGELIEVELPDTGTARFVRVHCGTGREFALPVATSTQTAHEGVAASYGETTATYDPEVRT